MTMVQVAEIAWPGSARVAQTGDAVAEIAAEQPVAGWDRPGDAGDHSFSNCCSYQHGVFSLYDKYSVSYSDPAQYTSNKTSDQDQDFIEFQDDAVINNNTPHISDNFQLQANDN